eukprot:403365107
MFSAKYKGLTQSILIHKDLKVDEFLDALSYSLQLPDGVIVGFQDRTGLIITPSFIVANPLEIKNEPYEVMLKSQTQQYYDRIVTGQNQNLQQNQASTLLLDTSTQVHQPQFNRQQQQQQARSFYDSQNQYQSPVFGGPIPPSSNMNSRSFHGAQSVNNNDRSNLVGSNGFVPSQPSSYQSSTNFNNDVQNQLNHQNEIILFVNSLQTDALLTENVRNKIISKARLRDSGIYGAYSLYLVDGDVESFKARVIHRALTPPTDYLSSATTAQFNWSASRASTQGGLRPTTRENSRMRGHTGQNIHSTFQGPQQNLQPQQPIGQDRCLPIILELENKGMLDEQTASLLKTLILEENVEVFRVINSYIAKAISDRELGFKLSRLSLQLSNYIERPQSPLPKKKNQLLNYVNSLARYHFNDPDDVQLLNKLIHEENEFILSCFDVFESDKDHDNLIDSLHRILEKSKAMGLHANSMTASSFYNQNPWTRSNQHTPFQAPINQTQSQSSIRQAQPYISKWEERGALHQNHQNQSNLNNLSQSHFANQSNIPRSSERPHGAVGSRRNMNTSQAAGSRNPANINPPASHFQNTTVHNVALIPNYFSSGEEEGPYFQSQQQLFNGNGNRAHSRVAHNGGMPHNYQYQQLRNPYADNYGQREFQVKEEYSDDLSRGSRDPRRFHNDSYQRKQKPKMSQHQEEEEDNEAQEIVEKNKKKNNQSRGKSQGKHQTDKSEKKSKESKKKRKQDSSVDSDEEEREKHKKSKSKKTKSKSKKVRDSSSDSASSKSSSSDNSDKSSQSDSDSTSKKKQKKSAKKNKKVEKVSKKDKKSEKKQPKVVKPIISKEEISEILEDEEIEKILRHENMAILTQLINEQDQDLLNCFVKYQEDDDSEYLISFIESKTEDALQYLVMKNFSNEENAKIRQLRSQRNDAIRRAFKKFRKTLDTTKLVNGIRKILPQAQPQPTKQILQNSPDRGNSRVFKEPSRKEKLDSIFNMIYHAEFSRVENVAKVINQLFHVDKDPVLLSILESYQKHNNYLDLKNQVQDYLKDKIVGFKSIVQEDPELPINITDAINLLAIRGEMAYQDQQLLLQLQKNNDKHLIASWEAFKVIKKMDDLLDNLLILCEVKRDDEKKKKLAAQQQQQQIQQQQQPVTRAQVNDVPPQTMQVQSVSLFGMNRAPAPQTEMIQPNRLTLMSTQQQQQQPIMQQQQQQEAPRQSSSGGGFTIKTNQTGATSQPQQQDVVDDRRSDHNLNINHNPDDSDVEDFQSIIEYQHKILRKYTIRGFIKYSDAPIFHEMVDQKDYKMISIFEVFAINRDEDDFLENLGLLAQIFLEQDNEHNTTISEAVNTEQDTLEIQQQQLIEEFPSAIDLQDPRIAIVHSLKEKLTPEEHKWCIQAVKDATLKNLLVIIDVFKVTKDELDLIHSLKKIYKMKSGAQ